MSPRNHAIALYIGWEDIPGLTEAHKRMFEGYMLKPKDERASRHDIAKVPDFEGSLDAMHKAVRIALNRRDFPVKNYTLRLTAIVTHSDDFRDSISDFLFFHTTAAQQAQAFCEVTGCYKEESHA